MKRTLVFLVLLVAVSFAHAAQVKPSAIYGDDDRKDVFEIQDPRIRELSRSVAGMTLSRFVKENENDVELITESYGKRNGFCKGTRYYDQPAVINCTAFLIAPDRVALAGHCVDEDSCHTRVFAFGFELDGSEKNPARIPKKDFYSCRRVIAWEKNPQVDFAVVELDRPVPDRAPLKVRTSGRAAVGDAVFMLGYPLGSPLKLADNATIRKVDANGDFYVTNVDSFAANSGSPLFNSRSLEVEGIVVRGGPDFQWDEKRDCRVEKRDPVDEGQGEGATAIHHVLRALEQGI